MIINGLPEIASFVAKHGNAEGPLKTWRSLIEKNSFAHIVALKITFGSADYSKPFTIFDIGGNKFRIIALISYAAETVFIKHVFTHPEYDAWNRARTKGKRKQK